MKDKLEEINSINGVKTSFVFFNDGEVVFDKLPSGFDPDNCMEIAKDVVQVSAMFDRLATPLSEFDFKYDTGRVIVFPNSNFNLIVLCLPTVSISMLRLTVNVALADLENDKKFQKRIQKIETSRRSFLVKSNMDAETWALAEIVN